MALWEEVDDVEVADPEGEDVPRAGVFAHAHDGAGVAHGDPDVAECDAVAGHVPG